MTSVTLGMLVAALPAGAAVQRTPTLAPTNTVIDGPSSDITALTGMSVARDGTGGIIYVKQVGGVDHVFVSSLLGGSFQPPQQIDTGLPGPSSQPVIAAGEGGLMVAALINGGELYTVVEPNALSAWQAPAPMFGGASNPAVSMSTLGKAYLAFTAPGAGGHDVRAAYYFGGQWTLASVPLDANPADDAGTGTGRPAVLAAGDGTGIVVWGENGHIYSRRVLKSSPSIAVYQADPPSYGGWQEVSADSPMISGGGDSSYAAVVFREVLSSGGTQETRVLFNRLHSDLYDATTAVDGLSMPSPQNGDQPRAAADETGIGFATAEQTGTNNLFALSLGTNDLPEGLQQINSLPEVSAPDSVPAAAGAVSTFIAWQQDQGSGSFPEIRLRYAPDGTDLNAEQVVSSPALGPTDADLGLTAAGDLSGDAAVAWVQGTGAQKQIVAAQLFQAPSSFNPTPSKYSTSVNPLLQWTPASELWGAPQYVVKADGNAVIATTATSVRVPGALSQGSHRWQVTAYNRAGVGTNASRSATVFVDSIAPRVSFKITGPRRVGGALHAYITDTDTPNGLPRSQASGVASVQIKWGDGSKAFTAHRASHSYTRRGHFVVTVIVKDRAGNRTVVTKKIKIAARAKPQKAKPKAKGRHHSVRKGRL